MPPKKAPLAERNANIQSKKSTNTKQKSGDPTPQTSPDKNPSLIDVANKIATIYGKKRPRDEEDSDDNDVNTFDDSQEALEFLESIPEINVRKWNCDEIRSKINAVINNGEMKVGEFQNKIDVTPSSYGNFMGKTGPDNGARTQTFINAQKYFIGREKQGIPLPSAKRAKTSAGSSKKDNADKFDVSGTTLAGEEDQAVPIYDTCDDLRTKIRAHLRQPGQTQASLARAMGQTYEVAGDSNHKIRGEQIRKFLGKKGPTSGATSSVYYAGYVYFEKLRLKQNKPKTKKRQEMERAHGPNGVPTDVDSGSSYVTLMPNETVSEDKYGVTQITQLPPGAYTRRLPPSKRSIF